MGMSKKAFEAFEMERIIGDIKNDPEFQRAFFKEAMEKIEGILEEEIK